MKYICNFFIFLALLLDVLQKGESHLVVIIVLLLSINYWIIKIYDNSFKL